MKVLAAGLQTSITSSYDKTKTTIFGRAFSKTISSVPVIGPPLTGFINTQLDAGAIPSLTHTTAQGRHFEMLTVVSGVAIIALYNIDITGVSAPSYVGRLFVRLPNSAATTHTVRGFQVWDGANSGVVTGWQIYIGTTASIVINGGLFVVNNVALADFSPTSPPTIEMAVAGSAKGVYFLQDPGTIGVANTLTAMQGMALDYASRRVYFHNNVLATTQFAVFDPSVALTITTQTTTAPTASGSPTFTLTGHGYVANDPVVITANAPTSFTVSTAVAAQTVYFVRATNLTANTFELSATSGGAAINATSITASTVFARAFGITTAPWLSIRTGIVTGFIGTFLLTNSESIVTPSQSVDSNIPSAVNNQVCLFLATSTNFYFIKVSEITNGSTTFPNMVTVNNIGTGTDFTSIGNQHAAYSQITGKIIYVSNTAQFYSKKWINSMIESAFGGTSTTYLENSANAPYTFAGVTIVNLDVQDGWLYATLSTTGQRGVLYMDFRSDDSNSYSYLTSPVLDTSQVFQGKTIQTIERLFDLTSTMVFSYKTAATFADATFNSTTTGWTVVETATDLSSILFNNFTQFRVDFAIAVGNINTPAQINDLFLSYTGKNELSDYWEGSVDNTSVNGASPAYTAFRLLTAYATSVPTLYFRSYDDSGSLVTSANTSANPTLFEYSTNNGTSWIPLGTIPNTALTTEVRYKWASPPGVRITSSLREA